VVLNSPEVSFQIVLRKVNGKWLMAAYETAVRDQPL
jgi:hypothetical protein